MYYLDTLFCLHFAQQIQCAFAGIYNSYPLSSPPHNHTFFSLAPHTHGVVYTIINFQLTGFSKKDIRGFRVIHAELLIRGLHTSISKTLYPFICFVLYLMAEGEAVYHIYAFAILELHKITILSYMWCICAYVYTYLCIFAHI